MNKARQHYLRVKYRGYLSNREAGIVPLFARAYFSHKPEFKFWTTPEDRKRFCR